MRRIVNHWDSSTLSSMNSNQLMNRTWWSGHYRFLCGFLDLSFIVMTFRSFPFARQSWSLWAKQWHWSCNDNEIEVQLTPVLFQAVFCWLMHTSSHNSVPFSRDHTNTWTWRTFCEVRSAIYILSSKSDQTREIVRLYHLVQKRKFQAHAQMMMHFALRSTIDSHTCSYYFDARPNNLMNDSVK